MEIYEHKAPASIKEIESWEVFFHVSMPEDLKALLLKNNGPGLYAKDINKELQVLGAKEAIDYFDAYEFTKYCPDAIPICADGCCNFVVYKKVSGAVSGTYVMGMSEIDWDDAKFLKATFAEVIEMRKRVEDVLNS